MYELLHFQENRRSREEDVNAIEVTWQPQNMLTDVSCFDMDRTQLLYKASSGDGQWQAADARMRSAGQASKWTLKEVKPCLQYEFAIKVRVVDLYLQSLSFQFRFLYFTYKHFIRDKF